MVVNDYFKTGAGEFALWNENDGIVIWRRGNKFFKDTRHISEKAYIDRHKTETISKTEYLKYLSMYGKLLQNERM